MKLLRAARASGVAFAFVLLGAGAFAAVSPFWGATNGASFGNSPSVNGPWLGDYNVNLYNLWRAISGLQGLGYSPGLSVSQTSGQANCTQINGDALQEIKTSASTGYVCLPRATPGHEVLIGNATTQTINIYGSATTWASGTQDTINGTAGTTPYTGLTNGKNADCFSASGGAWYCASGN